MLLYSLYIKQILKSCRVKSKVLRSCSRKVSAMGAGGNLLLILYALITPSPLLPDLLQTTLPQIQSHQKLLRQIQCSQEILHVHTTLQQKVGAHCHSSCLQIVAQTAIQKQENWLFPLKLQRMYDLSSLYILYKFRLHICTHCQIYCRKLFWDVFAAFLVYFVSVIETLSGIV